MSREQKKWQQAEAKAWQSAHRPHLKRAQRQLAFLFRVCANSGDARRYATTAAAVVNLGCNEYKKHFGWR
jgi:hypothetical protein